MIKTEFFKTRQDGVNLVRTYSDSNFQIKQINTGNIYDAAIDIGIFTTINGVEGWYPRDYNYEETNELVEVGV